MYAFETGEMWREREITDYHKRNTTDGKPASIRIIWTYSRVEL
jgi:hypothetical protein